MFLFSRSLPGFLAAGALLTPGACRAANFASSVLSFEQGNAIATWSNSAAALGAPHGVTGDNPAASNYWGFPNVLSPFSGAYQGDEIVQIGEGGHLTLALSRYVEPAAGLEIGVFTNASLIDNAWPAGENSAPAFAFGGGSAVVKVSADAVNWVSLGAITFDRPTLVFTNADPYDAAAPASPELADFGLPFDKPLSTFDGTDWTQTLQNFKVGDAYSAGGTWLDLNSSGLARIGYVQFSIPDDGDDQTMNRLAIDAISIAFSAAGATSPTLPPPGDANLDGLINGDDYFRIDSAFLAGGTVGGFVNGDFNSDGRIDIDDYFVIDAAYSRAAAPPPIAIPEPATLVMLLPMALLAWRRRMA